MQLNSADSPPQILQDRLPQLRGAEPPQRNLESLLATRLRIAAERWADRFAA